MDLGLGKIKKIENRRRSNCLPRERNEEKEKSKLIQTSWIHSELTMPCVAIVQNWRTLFFAILLSLECMGANGPRRELSYRDECVLRSGLSNWIALRCVCAMSLNTIWTAVVRGKNNEIMKSKQFVEIAICVRVVWELEEHLVLLAEETQLSDQ